MDTHDSLAPLLPFEPTGVSPEPHAAPPPRHRHTRRIIGISFVGLLCLGFLALLGSQLLTPAPNQAEPVSPLIGRSAPDFTLPLLNVHDSSGPASSIHLASLKGKPLILNFWASWCDACKQEAPLLATTWSSLLQQRGVLLLGIDFQDTRPNALAFVQKYAIAYPNVVDDTGATAINYGVAAVPETFFINRQGMIISKVIGEVTEQALQQNMRLIV